MSRRHLDPSSSSWRDSHQRGYERDDERGNDQDYHRPSAYAASKFRARPSSSATVPPWQRRRGGDTEWREGKEEAEEGIESTRYSQGGDSADEGFGRYENEEPLEDAYRHERRVAPTARRRSSRSRSGSRDFNDGGNDNSPPDFEGENRRGPEHGDEENCSEDGFVDDDELGFIDDVDDDVEDDVDDGQPRCDESPRSRHQSHHSYHRHHHHHRRHRSRRDIGRRPTSRYRSRSRTRRHLPLECEGDQGGHDEEELEEQPNGGRSRRSDHRDREKEKAKRARRRDRDYARKMAAAQQAPLHMAMMQSMMGMRPPGVPHMGMMPPFLPGMPGMMPSTGKKKKKKKHRRREADGGEGGGGGGEGALGEAGGGGAPRSSSSSSSSSGTKGPSALPPGPWGPGMPGMSPFFPTGLCGGQGAPAFLDLEAFISKNAVEQEAADHLRSLALPFQQAVMALGPLLVSSAQSDDQQQLEKERTAKLMARIRDIELGMIPPAAMAPTGPLAAGVPPPGFGGPRPPMMQMPPRMPQPRQAAMPRPPRQRGPKPMADDRRTPRRSAKDAIEALIEDHNLSAGCAWMLRSLPPDRQKLAAKIDPSGRDDPSGFVAEQLRMII